jgi:hypothetical protein
MSSPDDSRNDPLERVRERVEDQAHDHWHEFAVIVASANVLLALVLYGRILKSARVDYVTALATAIAVTSTLAAMFAYYSIQVGILFVVGPLRLTEVLVSFMIAAVQLALFLWPAHVLGDQPAGPESVLDGLRHWLLFFAAFSFAGPLANWYAARTRKSRNPSLVVAAYETRQQADRRAGFASCAIVTFCWFASNRWPATALSAGVVVALAGLIFGTISQERVARQVATIL